MQEAKEIIREHARRGAELREIFFGSQLDQIVEVSKLCAVTLAGGGKLLFCGNGGSAADCQHLAAEFVNRFMIERPALPALALTTDTSVLTSISNDYSYSQIFKRQVQAHGRPGDILVGLSTSGHSENVLLGLREAMNMGLVTVGLCGLSGEKMKECCVHLFDVPEKNTALVQEIHITLGHLICRLTDYFLFECVTEIQHLLKDADKKN